MGDAYLVPPPDIHREVCAVAVCCKYGIFQCVPAKTVVHLLGATTFGYPRQREFRILQYPRPVEFAVDIKPRFIRACHRAFDQFGGNAAAYDVSLVSGILYEVAYRAFAYINVHNAMKKTFDAVVWHAHHDIKIYNESPYLRWQIYRILPACIFHAVTTPAGAGLVEKAKSFYGWDNPDTDTLLPIFLHALNIRQFAATLAAVTGLYILGLIRLLRHHTGIAFMPRLTAGFLAAFLTQRRCAPLDFVPHTLFGGRHTAVAGVLWRLRVLIL